MERVGAWIVRIGSVGGWGGCAGRGGEGGSLCVTEVVADVEGIAIQDRDCGHAVVADWVCRD